ncbi:MAG: heavy metal translocating P-type ATPase [Spirochaetia bacterium]|nr:heavy metal translocating P-type ATPase [Spirochaetia bacterium]
MTNKLKEKEVIKEESRCFHCGDKIPQQKKYFFKENNQSLNEKISIHFCCKGCLQVYVLINESGNKNYYEYREEFSPRPDKEKTNKLPYEIWDEEIKPDEKGIKEASFVIQGIHCASCVWLNEKMLKKTKGIIEAEVQLATNRAKIKWNSKIISLRQISKIVAAIGYTALPVKKTEEQEAKSFSNKMLKRMVTAGFFTGNTMLISAALYAGYFSFMEKDIKNFFHYVSWFLATPVLLYSAKPFFQTAYYSLKQKILSMDLLTVSGISLAYFYSIYSTVTEKGEVYFDSVCFVTFAILIGRYIEAIFKERSLFYIENLGKSLPKTARILQNKNLKKPLELPIEKIKIDDIVLVYPEEIVPFDGFLVNPSAEVEESMLTGEFKAIHKKTNDLILAGSKCVGESIRIKVAKKLEDCAIHNISKLAEESLNRMPVIQKLAEKVSRYFIAFVFIGASATFLFWKFIKTGSIDETILHTISLLIAACPCALNLSIPTAYIVASQKAYTHGILMHGGRVLENIAKCDIVAFDKTGTLTEGNMKITKTHVFSNTVSQKKVLEIAYGLQKETQVKHPVSKAFLQKNIKTYLKFNKTKYTAGRGIRAFQGKTQYFLGSQTYMKTLKISIPQVKHSSTESLVYLAKQENQNKKILAVFFLSDSLRENSYEILNEISKKKELILLTGDQKKPAEQIAKKTGIKTIFAEVNPHEKKEIIESFQKKEKIITMVGDGINDAIALAKADTGISFANAAEISIYSSDILLMGNNLNQLSFLFRLALQTRKKVLQNLSFSFLYNSALLPLAFAGYLIPLIAALAMSASSIIVVLNSLRLYRVK